MNREREKIDILDGIGYVELIDVYGGDDRIVDVARISYGKELLPDDTTESKLRLISHLMKNRHTSPFEQVEFTFKLKVPIFVMRQIIRHRTANVNERSGRFTILENETYLPSENRIKATLGDVEGADKKAADILTSLEEFYAGVHTYYESLQKAGLSKELARIVLPVAQYTEVFWKIDLNNLFHFLKLRMDSHAQYETRQVAKAMAEYVSQKCPLAWQAFTWFDYNTLTLSQDEVSFLYTLLKSHPNMAEEIPAEQKIPLLSKITGNLKRVLSAADL